MAAQSISDDLNQVMPVKTRRKAPSVLIKAFLNRVAAEYGIGYFDVLTRPTEGLDDLVEKWIVVACWVDGEVRTVDGFGEFGEFGLRRLCEVLRDQYERNLLCRQ